MALRPDHGANVIQEPCGPALHAADLLGGHVFAERAELAGIAPHVQRDLLEAIVAYQKRDRRYGGIRPSPVAAGAK